MESVNVLAPAASPSDEMFAGDGGTLGGSWRRVLTTVCSVLSAHENPATSADWTDGKLGAEAW